MGAAARSISLGAYVLHSHEWSESSLIVELFTRDRGRLAVVAKGARRPYSQFRALLMPFQPIGITLGKAPADESADLFTLRQAEFLGGHPLLSGGALFAGFYLNELLLKSLARLDPHPALFDAYAATLPALQGADDPRAQAGLRAFELLMLRLVGVLPDLSVVTATQQPVAPQRTYVLRAESGVVPAPAAGAAAQEPGSLDGAVLEALESALAREQLDALQRACLPALGPLRHALRGLLHHHLGTSQLRTRQVFQGVQRLLETPPRPAR
jgi:DNA repair protein RecO (recombination protein O)